MDRPASQPLAFAGGMDGKSPLNEVAVGPYLLTIGSPAGTTLRGTSADAEEESRSLADAFDTVAAPSEPAGSVATAVTDLTDEAADATSRVEQALALGKGISEGRTLDPAQLGLEVDTLLDLLGRLDREGKHEDALRLARALSKLYALLRRWAGLLRALRTVEKFSDLKGVAWAKHELGTLQLAAGDVQGAEENLDEARRLREQIGDRRDLAATEHNLQVQCEQLRQMLRQKELVRPTPRPPIPHLPLLIALAALLLASGVGAGVIAGSGGSVETEEVTTTETETVTQPPTPVNPEPEPNPEPNPEPEPKPEPEPEPEPEPKPEPNPEPEPEPGEVE